KLRTVLVLDVRHDQHVRQRLDVWMCIARHRQRNLRPVGPGAPQRLHLGRAPPLQPEAAVKQVDDGQRRLSRVRAWAVGRGEAEVAAARTSKSYRVSAGTSTV